MNRPKVLFCITKSNWGGAQAYVHTLSLRLQADGYDVTVALGGTGAPGAGAGQLAERLSFSGIRVIHLTRMARDLSLLRELRSFIELVQVVRREQPHVLHLNSSKAGILGALAGRLAGTPRIVFTAHGWPHREPRPLPMRLMIWIASWFTVLLSHTVIAVSECDRSTAPVFFSRRKVRIVRNGIAAFERRERNAARAALAPDLAQNFWFYMNAELHPNKGIDRALRALAQIRLTYPEAALVVVGNGQEELRLKSLTESLGLSDAVRFPGFIPEARTYLSAADVYLLPSRKEGLPMALLEAGVASLPVIASRTGGIPEVIEDGRTGWLVATKGVDSLAEAMRGALSDTDARRVRATALHDKIVQDFSEDRMYAETKALY